MQLREPASKGAGFLFDKRASYMYLVSMVINPINTHRGVLIAILACMAIFVAASPASANMTAMGDPTVLGAFPTFYQDASGLQVGLCLEDPQCPASPALVDMTADAGGEAFYQLATGEVTAPGGKSVAVDFNVEAAFLGVDPITFGRIQFTANGLEPNQTYTVQHPFGTSHFTVGANGRLVGGARAAQREETDGSFADTFNSPIAYLRSTSAPAGYLGNGVTPTTVTGGTVRNTLTVTGPGLPQEILSDPDPLTGERTVIQPAGITTDRFTVEGKLFDATAAVPPAPTPVEPDTDGDGVIDTQDRCINQVGPASNAGCPRPVIIDRTPASQPVAQPQTITNTIVQAAAAPVAAPVAQAGFSGRVNGISIRKGVLRARSPRGADVVRLTVRKGGKFVKRITVNVNDNGQRFSRTLTRKAGRYTVTIQAGNEQHDVLTFGPSVSRSFRVV